MLSHSVVSDTLRPHGLRPPGSSGDSPGKNTGVGCHALSRGPFHRRDPTQVSQPRDQTQVSCIASRFFIVWATREPRNTRLNSLALLQGIFLTQESNRYLLHCEWILYLLRYQESLEAMTNGFSLFQKFFIDQDFVSFMLYCVWILIQISMK